ncbi:MAG: hypothetical protein AB7Q01_01550 [Gammaproteobacteria bacterium]
MNTTQQGGYIGIDHDVFGGMSPAGTIIRDARVFGLLPDHETCAGWSPAQMQQLYDRVYVAWEPYGHLVSGLPPELAARHERIHGEAIAHARALGWTPLMEDD